MSTRSNIFLKVKEEDMGKVIGFSAENLPVGVKQESWESRERSKEHSECVKIEKPYIRVYCHWDGYPQGVGKSLLTNFKTYDQVLNLIAGGDLSSVSNNGIRHYANRKEEEWEYIKPEQRDEVKVREDAWIEYVYIFENDKWYVGIPEGSSVHDIVELTEDVAENGHPSER